MTQKQELQVRRLAKQVLALLHKPYTPETCDQNATDFEIVAVKLAHKVLEP